MHVDQNCRDPLTLQSQQAATQTYFEFVVVVAVVEIVADFVVAEQVHVVDLMNQLTKTDFFVVDPKVINLTLNLSFNNY